MFSWKQIFECIRMNNQQQRSKCDACVLVRAIWTEAMAHDDNENTFTWSHHMGDITHVYKSNYLLTLISTSFNHFNWGSYMGIYHKKDDIFVLYLCVMAQRHAIIIIIIICCWWWLKCHLPLVQKLLPSDLHWQSVEGVFALVFLFYFSAYDITQSSQSARCLNRRMRVAVVSPTRRYWSLDVKFQAFAVSLEIISN